MPTPESLPHLYRLLAVFSAGVPVLSIAALEVAGLRPRVTDPHDPRDPGLSPLTDAHRELYRELADRRGWIRWVKLTQPRRKAYQPGDREVVLAEGYVLTGFGEVALVQYRDKYGPVQVPHVGLGELARHRLIAMYATLQQLAAAAQPLTPEAALEAAGLRTPGRQELGREHEALVEDLLRRGWCVRQGKLLLLTPAGVRAIAERPDLSKPRQAASQGGAS